MGKTSTNSFPDRAQLQRSSVIMRALAHPLRLRMIALLNDQHSATVQMIYTTLKIEQSVASQHLRILRDAELVNTERQGKFMRYALHKPLLLRAGVVASTLAGLR